MCIQQCMYIHAWLCTALVHISFQHVDTIYESISYSNKNIFYIILYVQIQYMNANVNRCVYVSHYLFV